MKNKKLIIIAVVVIAVVAIAAVVGISLYQKQQLTQFYRNAFDREQVDITLQQFDEILDKESTGIARDDAQSSGQLISSMVSDWAGEATYMNALPGPYIVDENPFKSGDEVNTFKMDQLLKHTGVRTILELTTYDDASDLKELQGFVSTSLEYLNNNELPTDADFDFAALKANLTEFDKYLQKYELFYHYFRKLNQTYVKNEMPTNYVISGTTETARYKKLIKALNKIDAPIELKQAHQTQIEFFRQYQKYYEEEIVRSAKYRAVQEARGCTTGFNLACLTYEGPTFTNPVAKPKGSPFEKYNFNKVYTDEDDLALEELLSKLVEQFELIQGKLN